MNIGAPTEESDYADDEIVVTVLTV